MTEQMTKELGSIRDRLLAMAQGILNARDTAGSNLPPDIAAAKKLKWAASILKSLSINN